MKTEDSHGPLQREVIRQRALAADDWLISCNCNLVNMFSISRFVWNSFLYIMNPKYTLNIDLYIVCDGPRVLTTCCFCGLLSLSDPAWPRPSSAVIGRGVY